jgi:hypothetical protein
MQLQLHRNSFVSCSPPLWFVTFTSLQLVVETAIICTMMNLVMFLPRLFFVLCWKSTLFSSTKLWPFFPNLLSSLLSLALVLVGWLCRELLAYKKALYPLESCSFRLWCWVLFVLIYESLFPAGQVWDGNNVQTADNDIPSHLETPNHHISWDPGHNGELESKCTIWREILLKT